MNVMKKMILYVASLFLIAAIAAEPGSSLQQKFSETFPNAKNVKWADDKAGYYVSFMQNGNFKKAFYNKEGNFICSWKYSDGNDLPVNIIIKLNRKFEGAKIIGVTEYTSENNTLYNIKLSKGQKLYSLDMSSDGSISDEQKFNYQPAT